MGHPSVVVMPAEIKDCVGHQATPNCACGRNVGGRSTQTASGVGHRPLGYPFRLKYWTARSCASAAFRVAKVPRLRRFPVFASFFREYKRYWPELSFRIMIVSPSRDNLDEWNGPGVAQSAEWHIKPELPALRVLVIEEAETDLEKISCEVRGEGMERARRANCSDGGAVQGVVTGAERTFQRGEGSVFHDLELQRDCALLGGGRFGLLRNVAGPILANVMK
jgi:hypothetical protein